MRKRIAHWQNVPAADCGGEFAKKGKLVRMHKHLEELKILADINDPVIKKRFEDGEGDMDRPIYRHLANKRWREYKRLLLMQRISQQHIVPDMLPHLDPTAEVSLGFGRRNVQPGEFVDSRVSEIPARLTVQCFDKGERLVTIAVVDSDVPDVKNDSFTSRCHFLAVNIPISPTSTSVPLSRLKKDDHIVHSWLPPYAEKGAPYHRLAVFVIQQEKDAKVDLQALRDSPKLKRQGFTMRKLLPQNPGTPIGVNLFRSQWDEGTDGVIVRHGIKGANIEFLRKKPEKLPYKKKDGARYR
ncbi:large subunit ribosomal protein L35, partial [Lecanoromycetidae sp. Uapishka_2]